MPFAPQFLTSTDPRVLEQVMADDQGLTDLWDRAATLAQRTTGRASYLFSQLGSLVSVTALSVRPGAEHGRWKAGPGGHGWVPWASNPLRAEFEALTYTRPHLTGLPGSLRTTCGSVLGFATGVAVDGVVRVDLGRDDWAVADDAIDWSVWSPASALEHHRALAAASAR